MYDFGMRIQKLRMSQNMSQEALGKKLKRSKSVICGYENNQRTPPLEVLVNIAVIFNVSLDYLVGIDKNEMVSVDGLTDKQKEAIYALVKEFKAAPVSSVGLSISQQEVLNKIMLEFSKKHY